MWLHLPDGYESTAKMNKEKKTERESERDISVKDGVLRRMLDGDRCGRDK